MGSTPAQTPITQPWVSTPVIRSTTLSKYAGCNIFLKLETLQPAGSFKSRGIGNLMANAILKSSNPDKIHFYCSSGGNAGLACATASLTLNRPATIVLPTSTSSLMVSKIKATGVTVLQYGIYWREADIYLKETLLNQDPHGIYVPPFDHPDVWTGAESIINELETQLPHDDYDALVCSVGGGGLFIGLAQGLQRYSRLDSTKILCVETAGADSLSYSLKQGKLSSLKNITSIATSLGCNQVASRCYDLYTQNPEAVSSLVLSDAQAGMGCVFFADDERIVVEVACGVSVAVAYDGALLKEKLFPEDTEEEFGKRNVVVVVCGGSNVSLGVLEKYKELYREDEGVRRLFGKRVL